MNAATYINGLRDAASKLYPNMVRGDGKLTEDNYTSNVRLCPIAEAIAGHAPYEQQRPGCDDNLTPKLKAAVADGFAVMVSVWDSNLSVVMTEDGQKWRTL